MKRTKKPVSKNRTPKVDNLKAYAFLAKGAHVLAAIPGSRGDKVVKTVSMNRRRVTVEVDGKQHAVPWTALRFARGWPLGDD